MKSTITALVLALSSPAFSGVAAPASFEESLAPPADTEWGVHFALYGWLQSLDGDVTVGRTTDPLDLDFGDITPPFTPLRSLQRRPEAFRLRSNFLASAILCGERIHLPLVERGDIEPLWHSCYLDR